MDRQTVSFIVQLAAFVSTVIGAIISYIANRGKIDPVLKSKRAQIIALWRSLGETRRRTVKVAAAAAGLTVLILIIAVSRTQAMSARIVYPKAEGIADQTQQIRVAWSNLPDGQVLWIFVYSEFDQAYFPQRSCPVGESGIEWPTQIQVGTDEDSGKRFEVGLWLADRSAQQELSSYLDDDLHAGLKVPPIGTRRINHIELWRRQNKRR